MKTKIQIFIFFILFLLLFSSCSSIKPVNNRHSNSKEDFEQFIIDDSRDTTIFTRSGLRLYLPQNIFDPSLGNVSRDIQVLINDDIENFANQEFCKIQIEALNDKGNNLKMSSDKFIVLHVPKYYVELSPYIFHEINNEVKVADSSSEIYHNSLLIAYERKDLLEKGLTNDMTIPRMPLQDTSEYKTFSNYFDHHFPFTLVNYDSLSFPMPHVDFAVNRRGVISNVVVTRTSDSSFINLVKDFLLKSPVIDFNRLEIEDSDTVFYGMTFMKQNFPPVYQIAEGYRNSLQHDWYPDYILKIHFFSDIIKEYSIYNVHNIGELYLRKLDE